MGQRILLFIATNFVVILTLSVLGAVFGVPRDGLVGAFVPALIFGFSGSLLSLALSRWMAKKAYGVSVLPPEASLQDDERWLVDTVHRMSRDAGLRVMPEVGIYPSPEVNAFATGPSKNKSLVAVSLGLLQSMDQDEVEGVLAHEVAHIQNGDMVTMALLQGVINTFVLLIARIVGQLIAGSMRDANGNPNWAAAHGISVLLQMVLSVLGSLIVCWFSRRREFRADAGAAALAGRHKMIAALERLQTMSGRIDRSRESLNTMKISGIPGGNVFSTHPPLEQRIAALRNG